MSTKVAILWIEENGGKSVARNGYVCSSDNVEDVKRIPLNQLSPQHLYICNVKPNMFKSLGLGTYPNIKNSNFLGFNLSRIVIELDLNGELARKMTILYYVVSEAVKRFESTYNLDVTKSFYTILPELKSIINEDGTPTVKGLPNEELNYAIKNSLQKVQSIIQNDYQSATNQNIYSAQLPKTPYFFYLLSQNYPLGLDYSVSDEFDGVTIGTNEDGEIEGTTEVIQRLLAMSEKKTGFIKFTHNSTVSKFRQYYPFGKEIKRSVPREWAALPEIVDLANYSSLTLSKAFLTESGVLDIVSEMPNASQSTFFSYVNGLINEAIWMAISYHKMNKEVSSIASYLRAYDRIKCRQLTTKLIEKDFHMVGYSTACIRFSVQKENATESARLAREMIALKLVPQLNLLK